MPDKIIRVICPQCNGWRDVKRKRCVDCGRPVECGDCIASEVKSGGVCHGVYRVVRPKTMTPVEYYKKYKVVDRNFLAKCNGRYYCNPAHCSKSWETKAERDGHFALACRALD